MSLYRVLNDSQLDIYSEIMSALHGMVHNTRERLRNLSRKPCEPDYIAELAHDMPDHVNHRLQPYFNRHGVKLKASSVFVHKQPQVRSKSFPEDKAVEIGDILFIATHKNKERIERWALLLQAKIAENFHNITPDNQNQHILYQYWPEFEYIRSGNLNGQKRKVFGPNLYSGAKYLLFNPNGHCHFKHCFMFDCFDKRCRRMCHHEDMCLIGTAYPTDPLTSFVCFGQEFFDFLFGNAGREFMYQPKIRNDWDQVITDLLDETAKRCFKLAGDAKKHPRGHAFNLFRGVPEFVTSDPNVAIELQKCLGGNDNTRDGDFFDLDQEMPGGGVSTIEIIIDSTEMEK